MRNIAVRRGKPQGLSRIEETDGRMVLPAVNGVALGMAKDNNDIADQLACCGIVDDATFHLNGNLPVPQKLAG